MKIYSMFSFRLFLLIVVIVAFGPIMIGIPLKLGNYLDLESTPLYTGFVSNLFKTSLIVSICLLGPLVLDVTLYILAGFCTNVMKLLASLSLSVMIANCWIYIQVTHYSKVDGIPAIISIRNILLFYSVLSLIKLYSNQEWIIRPIRLTMGSLALLWLMESIQPFLTLHGDSKLAFIIIHWFFLAVAVTSYTYITFQWISKIYSKTICGGIFSSDEKSCGFHILFFMIFSLFFFTTKKCFSWLERDLYYLLFENYLCTAYVVLVTILNRQQVIKDYIQNKEREESATKQMVVGYFSHELRTPLNISLIGLKILHQELNFNNIHNFNYNKVKETVRDIELSCNMILDILNDLVVYEQLNTGNIIIQSNNILVQPLLENKLRPLQLYAEERHIQFSITIKLDDYSLAYIIGDEEKIHQVLRNIVSHALDSAGCHGKVEVIVSLSCGGGDGMNGRSFTNLLTTNMLHIEVRDSGPALPKGDQAVLFQGDKIEFTAGVIQTGKAGGLGLLISHKVMRLHKGDLKYTPGTSQGCGNIFTITIPLQYQEKTTYKRQLVKFLDQPINIRLSPSKPQPPLSPPVSSPNRALSDVPLIKRERQLDKLSQSKSASDVILQSGKISCTGKIACADGDDDNDSNNYDNSKSMRDNESDYLSTGTRRKSSNSVELKPRKLSFEYAIHEHQLSRPLTTTQTSLDAAMTTLIREQFAAEEFEKTENKRIQPPRLEIPIISSINYNKYRIQHVLVVDDVAMNRKMLCRLLEDCCDSIEIADDGQSAVNIIRQSFILNRPFDLILMDYQMPIMDGPTAAKIMRESGFTGPILGVTGNVMRTHIETFISCGANKVLPKPLDFKALQEALHGNNPL